MKRSDCVALSRRLIEQVCNNATDMAEEVVVEDASFYLDEGRWQAEKKKLFLETPQVVGFSGEVSEPGSYITAEVVGIPVIVSRDEAGTLHAFINACQHRGARVAEGCGSKKRLTCRFHGWSYSLDGKLAGRPKASAFESDTITTDNDLVKLPVSDNGGLLVVGLQPTIDQSVVDHYLDEIAPALSGFKLEQANTIETRRYEVAANWKLVTCLSHESYHFSTLHRESLAPMMTSHAVTDQYGLHTRWAFPLKGIESFKDKDESEWPDRPYVINHTISPGTIIVINPVDAQIIRAEPGDTPGTSVVYYSGICIDAQRMEDARGAYEFGGDIFSTEDLPAAEQCQQGIAAGRHTLSIGRNEPIVQFWHQQWHDAIDT